MSRGSSGRGALLCLLLLATGGAAADDAPLQVWLNAGIYSWHFDRDLDLRENNSGLGVEVVASRDYVWLAGSIINSERQRTHYAGLQWRPLHWRPTGLEVSAGLIFAALDGYPRMRDGGWFVTALPVLAVEGERLGLNLSIIPTIRDQVSGAVALQLKLRVW